MDSGVSILNFFTTRKVLSLLRSMTGLYFWLCLGTTGDYKTQETLCFLPFLSRSCSGETGYKRPNLGLSDGPFILTESGEIWLILASS